MKRIAAATALGLTLAALPLTAGPASASVTCGNSWTPGSAGPNARDYHWGNCGSAATKIDVYSLTYGGGIRTKAGEKCVAAGTAVLIGRTTQYLVTSFEGVDTHTAC
ncbi:hypothetical protein [Amycolatopsis sp. CA-128772]|uniref:hypothetical protein n=1 Tax=Amycolatopsis sp. CA-128772 TaxID=2073159 RepID=UPI0011B0D3CD|nr:hypothetical protein [Amycolatopsis sp. CA-128772]